MQLSRRDKKIRFFYGLLFGIVLFAIGYYIFGVAGAIYDSGALTPSGKQVVPYNEHGRVVYITATQDVIKDLCGVGVGIFFCLYIMLGTILQGVYKVPIYGTSINWIKPTKNENAPRSDTEH